MSERKYTVALTEYEANMLIGAANRHLDDVGNMRFWRWTLSRLTHIQREAAELRSGAAKIKAALKGGE